MAASQGVDQGEAARIEREHQANQFSDSAGQALMSDNFGEALELYLSAIGIARELGHKHSSTLSNLAIVYDRLGRHTDAIRTYKERIEQDGHFYEKWKIDPSVGWTRSDQMYHAKAHTQEKFFTLCALGKVLVTKGDLDAAEESLAEVRALVDQFYKLPEGRRQMRHPDYRISVLTTLRAPLSAAKGDYGRAAEDWERGFELSKRWNAGAVNMNVHSEIKQLLAGGYSLAGRYKEAEALLGEVVEVEGNQFVRFSDVLAQAALLLGQIAEGQGDFNLAEKRFATALEELEKDGQPTRLGYRTEIADVMSAWSRFNIRQGKLAEARPRLNRAIELRLATQGPIHPDYGEDLVSLASIEALQGNYAEAEAKARQGLGVLSKELVENHPRQAAPLAALAALSALQGKGGADQTPEAAKIKLIAEKPLGPPYASAMESIARYAGLLRAAKLESDAAALEALGKLLRESPGP